MKGFDSAGHEENKRITHIYTFRAGGIAKYNFPKKKVGKFKKGRRLGVCGHLSGTNLKEKIINLGGLFVEALTSEIFPPPWGGHEVYGPL